MNNDEYAKQILHHKRRASFHDDEVKRLSGEFKQMLAEQGIEGGRTHEGVSFSLGKEQVHASVPWNSLKSSDKEEVFSWMFQEGCPQSVNAATFSAWVRDRDERGLELHPQVKLYTTQRLNVRGPKEV